MFEPWMDDALCAETYPELFFPEKGAPETADMAKKVCGVCEVRQQCLEYALAHHEVGVWGQTTFKERAQIRRQRRKAA